MVIKQKCTITIETADEDNVSVSQEWTPPLDLKNPENNDPEIVHVFQLIMEALRKNAKKK